jgi:putative ABC transport system permease protein
MDAFIRNVRLTLRQLHRQPAFAATVILTLGLAIAANTTIFSFVNALLIRPFPFHDPDQLVQIRSVRGGQLGMLSMREILDIREQISAVDQVAGHTSDFGGYNYSGEGHPQEWKAILTTGNLFEVLGAPLEIGSRWPELQDRERDNRIILTYGVWRENFGAQGDVVGKKITLDHAPGYRIDGVARSGFDYPQGVEVYRSIGGFAAYDRRDFRNLVALARIRRPNNIALLQSQLDGLSLQLATAYPSSNADLSFRAVSFRELYSGDVKPYLLVLFGAAAFVLLIACANVVNLQLSRAIGRGQEMGIRIALGAGRASLFGQLLTESVLLSVVAGAFGILLALWWVKLLRVIIGVGLPKWMVIDIDGCVLLFTAGISMLAAVVSGLAPALELSRQAVLDNLREGGRGNSGGRKAGRLRDAMVVGEIAVALMLLAGAGLLIRGFLDLTNQEKGFRSSSVSTFRVALGWKRYIDQPSISRYYERALDELAHVPGFEGTGFVNTPPLTGQSESAPSTVQVDGQSLEEAMRNPYVTQESISENYFELLGIPLKAGRFFTKFDGKDSEPVAIVSSRLAKTLWPATEALGHRILYDPGTVRLDVRAKSAPFRTVVGVVGDVQEKELGGEAGLDLCVPYRQKADANQYMLVRTKLEPSQFTALAERAMWSIDPEQSVFDFKTYDRRILDSVWQLRISRMLLILFAGVALVLAAIGIYGVMSYAVNQRRREVGVRLALGASPENIRALIVKRGALVGLSGLGIGGAGALILGRVLQHALRGIAGVDQASFAFALLALFAVTLAASAMPAWRASRIDPVITLRGE